jgi:hypothetical protein
VFRVQREDGAHDLKVTLGGGVELSSAPFDLLADLIQPKVEMTRDPRGGYIARRPASAVREVSVPPLPDDEPAATAPTAADKISLLERALDRYQSVIELQQRELSEEAKRRESQDELIQSLQSEMEALRKAIAAEKDK